MKRIDTAVGSAQIEETVTEMAARRIEQNNQKLLQLEASLRSVQTRIFGSFPQAVGKEAETSSQQCAVNELDRLLANQNQIIDELFDISHTLKKI